MLVHLGYTMTMKLQIIIGSTRPARKGPMVARYVEQIAKNNNKFTEVELLDLVDYNLPLLDEVEMPSTGIYAHEHTKKWSAKISEAQAYIFVTPEYNAGYPASLKNAIDYLYKEWGDKPAGIISYGGRSGGKNSADGLVKVLNKIGMKVVEPQVNIVRFTEIFDQNEMLIDDSYTISIKAVVDKL